MSDENLPAGTEGTWRRHLAQGVAAVVVVALFVLGARVLYKNRPQAERKPPRRRETLASTVPLRATRERVTVRAMGTVIPARRVELRSRVSGEVIEVSGQLVEGGRLSAGDVVLKIDPADHELGVKRAAARVTDAEYRLALELGRQDVAKREWELLQRDGLDSARDQDLVLRRPHLEKARADLASAEADLALATLMLERATVRAPFNAVVLSRHVDLGSHASVNGPLVTLAGTDEYWVRVSVPLDRLEWITIPGAPARVHRAGGMDGRASRDGAVTRLLADVEPEGRMARLLVSVHDPVGGGGDVLPLVLGEFVRVAIEGREIDGVFRFSRDALREGSLVWIVDDEGKLDVRPVEVAWRETGSVLVRGGLSDGELLVVSDLPSPVQGMSLRVLGDNDAAEGQAE